MTFLLWAAVGVLLTIGIWAIILYLFARADKPYLEQDKASRIFGGEAALENREGKGNG